MTVRELAKRLRRRQKWTAEMLAEWQAAGIAEEVNGRWRLTEHGFECAAVLLDIDLPTEQEKDAA